MGKWGTPEGPVHRGVGTGWTIVRGVAGEARAIGRAKGQCLDPHRLKYKH